MISSAPLPGLEILIWLPEHQFAMAIQCGERPPLSFTDIAFDHLRLCHFNIYMSWTLQSENTAQEVVGAKIRGLIFDNTVELSLQLVC